MATILEKEKLIHNFNICANWEEKYLYIIELGEKLTEFPPSFRRKEYIVSGCQSQVWIVVEKNSDNIVQLRGDSDSAIVKGLIAIVFKLYQGMTPLQIIKSDVRPWFTYLGLVQHLTPSRSHGLNAMVHAIYSRAKILC